MPKKSGYKNTKRFEKSVKDIVLKELSEELEEKHAIVDYQNVAINRAIPSGIVLNSDMAGSTGNFYKILPEIEQSATVSGDRFKVSSAPLYFFF